MSNRHIRRCSALLIIVEMQFKTTVRYHLKPVKMAIVKKKTQNPQINVGKDVEKMEYSDTVGGDVNWSSHCGKQHEVVSTTKNRTIT